MRTSGATWLSLVIVASLGWLGSLATGCTAPETQRSATTTGTEGGGDLRTVMQGAGDVRFLTRSIGGEIRAVAAADFDGDGHADLLGAAGSRLTIHAGDGRGGLIPSGSVSGGENPVDFAVADLDGDGDLDVAVANHATTYLTLLHGDGAGAFVPAPGSPLPLAVRPHPHAVRAGDLDADGHVDLVVDHRDAEGLLVLRGLGGGRLESPGRVVEVGGDPYRGMAIGDLNGDGRLDLVTPNPHEVGVFLNAGGSGVEFVRADPVEAETPFAVALGDFDADARLDLIVASGEESALVELFLGDGNGGFRSSADSPFVLARGAKNVAVGDFDGDGVADAAVACYHASEVLLLFGGARSIRIGRLSAGSNPWGLAIADFDEDGRDDLVVADDASGTAMLALSRGRQGARR